MTTLLYVLLGVVAIAGVAYLLIDWVAHQVDLDVKDHEE